MIDDDPQLNYDNKMILHSSHQLDRQIDLRQKTEVHTSSSHPHFTPAVHTSSSHQQFTPKNSKKN
jgi:hypothetical protein